MNGCAALLGWAALGCVALRIAISSVALLVVLVVVYVLKNVDLLSPVAFDSQENVYYHDVIYGNVNFYHYY